MTTHRFTYAALILAAMMAILAVRLGSMPAQTEPADSTKHADSKTIPPIRVRLTAAEGPRLEIRVEGVYRVTALGDWQVLAQGTDLPAAEVKVEKDGLRIGGQQFPLRRLAVEILDGGRIWVGRRCYRGNLHLIDDGAGRAIPINVVPLEVYLPSVVAAEMPSDFPPAACRAQAIAARTYALYHMKTYGVGNDFDVYDTSRSQNYRGVEYLGDDDRPLAGDTKVSRAAVRDTGGVVLGYRGRIFCAYYSAVCGGHSTAGREIFGRAAPPLVGVPCEGCHGAPHYRWEATIAAADFAEKLQQAAVGDGKPLGELQSVETIDRGGGVAPQLKFHGAKGDYTISAIGFKSRIRSTSLHSPIFTAKLETGTLRISGRGWGHGVGMCQWGTRGYGQQGWTTEEILAHYYPGSELMKVE